MHTIHIRDALTCTIINFGCVFITNKKTPQTVFMIICYFVNNFTPKFRSTGRAMLYTILIDRPASGLKTYLHTDCNILHSTLCFFGWTQCFVLWLC